MCIKDREKKIATIVVTYNRICDLQNCITALKQQTLYSVMDIIVVNNGSTDGTTEYLDSMSGIIVINQANLGGAGGFYAGMKYAYEHNYEWLWLMDDDGIPEKKELEILYTFSQVNSERKFLNALVVSKDDHKQFAFKTDVYDDIEIAQEKEYFEEFIHPFNGTFIHRSVVEKIGLIKKEMFIWGDEQEYVLRSKKNGYVPTTVTKALHYHPREKGTTDYVLPLGKIGRVLIKPEKLSAIYYRNQGYIHRQYGKGYKGFLTSVKFLFYNCLYWIKKMKVKEFYKLWCSYKLGRKGIFN